MADAVFEGRAVLGQTLFPELAAAGLSPREQLSFARFRFWRVLLPVAIWYSFYYLGRLNWGISLPWIIKDLGITRLEAGIAEAALFWGYAGATLLAGRASDRLGARFLQFFGGVGTTVMNILVALQSTATGVLIFMWGNGLVQGLASAPTTRMNAQWYPRARRGFANGVFVMSFSLSTLVAWAITGYVVANYGWRAAFTWPLLVFVLPTTIALFFLVRDRPEDAGFPPYKEPDEDTVSTRAEALTEDEVRGPKAWLILMKDWGFMSMCLAAFTTYIGRFGLLTWTPLYWAETAGIKLKDVPVMTFALPVGMILGPFLAGIISDKFFKAARHQVIVGYLAGAIICLTLMASIPIQTMGLFWAMALLFFSGFFILGVIGSQWTMAMDSGARKLAGTAVGFYNGFNYLGAGVQGILIGGILHWSNGNWTLVFGVVAVLLAIGALLMIAGRRA
jgi:OPA family glycerol-3-phosphate transporter-like MFS transporter